MAPTSTTLQDLQQRAAWDALGEFGLRMMAGSGNPYVPQGGLLQSIGRAGIPAMGLLRQGRQDALSQYAANRRRAAMARIQAGIGDPSMTYAGQTDFGPTLSPGQATTRFMNTPQAQADLMEIAPSAALNQMLGPTPYQRERLDLTRRGQDLTYAGKALTNVRPTPAQFANNTEIDSSRAYIRRKLADKPKDMSTAAWVRRLQTKASDMGLGFENPDFDPDFTYHMRVGRQRKVGDDRGFEKFIGRVYGAEPASAPGGQPSSGAAPPALPPASMFADPPTDPFNPTPAYRAGQTVRGITGTPAERRSPAGTNKSMERRRSKMQGSGTQADPFRPTTTSAMKAIRPGEIYINPADGKPYRKR